VKDNERIRDELLAITLGVWNFIKNHSAVDASRWALEWVGFLPGKRESRRFVGQHVLSESDLLHSRPFDDAIAYGGWPIDTHPPEGVDAPELPPCEQRRLPFLYDVPLRACVSAGPHNLMFAGRNISATHIAFASTRVMATCGVIGQGVGTAAAIAMREGVLPGQVAARPDIIKKIQQRLLRDDCYLIGLRNDDTDDLVRRAAAITASSEQEGGEAFRVKDGLTRSMYEKDSVTAAEVNLWDDGCNGAGVAAPGLPEGRGCPGLHRWMSAAEAGLPAWLEVRWPLPQTLGEVIAIFDTGLHRLLTLSQADDYTRRMLWGQPQPETVRDYVIQAETCHQQWQEIVRVEGNYQRRRVHVLKAPVTTSALRIVVSATNGIDHARLVELRAYCRPG
jgi:hypothetical protein